MRRIAISDCHFGSPGALGSLPLALERLEPELAWAEEVIICGDLFTLMFSDWNESVAAARPFLKLIADKVDSVVFVPGNHDHHFTLWNEDQNRCEEALGHTVKNPRSLEKTEQFLRELLPKTEVRAVYPYVELDGVSYIHGHHIEAMVCEIGIPSIDNLLWRWRASFPRKLETSDYESLLALFYEIGYLTQQSKEGTLANRQRRELLEWSRAAIVACGSKRQTKNALLGRKISRNFNLPWRPKPLSARIELIARLCQDFGVPPGLVVYAHTHVPHEGIQAKHNNAYTFWNCGSWHFEERFLHKKLAKHFSHPGTVLRIDNGILERKELLVDVSNRQIQQALLASR